MDKPKLAVYGAASCGGCDIAVLDTEAKLLEIAAFFDIVFWPCLVDTKQDRLCAMDDAEIALALVSGAIRSSEDYRMARLLRQKSERLCALGACACDGCIPGLANLTSGEQILRYVYHDSPSTVNPENLLPQPSHQTKDGGLRLAHFWNTVRTLTQVVDVDFLLPGCPPQPDQLTEALTTLIDGYRHDRLLPTKGAVLGVSPRACCEECPREREVKKITSFVRPHEIVADPEVCLLEQGIVCMGPATRGGCGAACVKAGVPCQGCYGAPPGVRDQGARMASAIAGVIDSSDPEEIDRIIAGIPDLMGTLYRFSLPRSTLRRRQP